MSSLDEVHQFLCSAEEYAASDPATAIWKAGLAGEFIVDIFGKRTGVIKDSSQSQETYLEQLEMTGSISFNSARKFHQLRRLRNGAAHRHVGAHSDAIRAIALARTLERLLEQPSLRVREVDSPDIEAVPLVRDGNMLTACPPTADAQRSRRTPGEA